MKIVITCTQMARDVDLVRPVFDQMGMEVVCPPVVQELSGAELVAALDGAVGVIAGDDRFTAEVIARCPDLKVISKWGIGVDAIDLAAAAEHGVAVTNTPSAFDDEVADVTLGYLVLLARQLHVIDRGVRNGQWPKPVGTSLAGRTLGVVGLGGIGRAVARRALAMGMIVVGTDPSRDSRQEAKELGVETVAIDELLHRSAAVTLNCPLNPTTFHLMNQYRFSQLQRGAYLINTARGPVVDEQALVEALEAGTVAGAALDVFEREPLSPGSPLLRFDQVIFGAHNASNTREASVRTHWRALRNLIEALDLEMP